MKIIGTGSAIPDHIESNDEIEIRLGLEPGWIARRTGVLGRARAAPDEATSDLAVRAGFAALQRSGLPAHEIGLLLLATSTPDHLLPPTSPLVAHRLGLAHSGAIDLAGACAGFLYALILANAYGQSIGKPVMVIGANILTRRVNHEDAATASLFSDGAGAVVLSPAQPSHFLGSFLGSDGSHYDTIGIPAGGTREPLTAAGLEQKRNLMTMRRGSSLFKEAIHAMVSAGKEALRQSNRDAATVDWWIPHQANSRIIRETGKQLGIAPERTIDISSQYGNSSAASIPLALDLGIGSGQIHPGELLLFTAAGAGMLSAGLLVRN